MSTKAIVRSLVDDLKKYRKLRRLTQKTVAEQIGVSANTVARWERGEMSPGSGAARLIDKMLRGWSSSDDRLHVTIKVEGPNLKSLEEGIEAASLMLSGVINQKNLDGDSKKRGYDYSFKLKVSDEYTDEDYEME